MIGRRLLRQAASNMIGHDDPVSIGKGIRQLAALREENTARLWEKARLLEVDDVHWWEVVRKEIEKAIEQIEADIETLNAALAVLERPETPA